MAADLPEVREGKWYFENLWVNGARATRARTPNEEWFPAASAATEPVAGVKLAGPLDHTALMLHPEDLATLQGLSPAELHDVNAIVYHSWNTSRHRVAGWNEQGTLQFTGPARWSFFQLEPYHRVVLENYRAALDAPGEWFLDRQGKLLYLPLPGQDIATAEVVAPVTARWIELRGVEHLRFRGLRFAHTQYLLPEAGWTDAQADAALGAAIEADNSHDVVFEHCDFSHTAAYALWFRHGCREMHAVHCLMQELGAGGVKIGETAIPQGDEAQTGHNSVESCIIQHGGRYFTGSVGVWIGQSGDNSLLHNDIGDFYYSAISVGWVWGFKSNPAARNLIEWNHLHHLGWGVLSDMGAVYTLGPAAGTVISHNRVHDISCYSYGGWGLYPDEGSSDLVLEDNLVYRTQSGGFHQHYGANNLVRNNIFADAQEFQLRHSRTEDHLAFTFERNVVWWKTGKLLGHLDAGWKGSQVKLNHNLYWRTDGAPFDFAGQTLADWQATGQDEGSVIADPLFVDPERGDFHLQPGSPAARIGFKPFDYEKAGVEGLPEWQELATHDQYPPMTFAALKLEPAPLLFHEGFEFSTVGPKMGPLRLTTGGPASALQIVPDQASKGQKCLQLTDSPEAKPAFNPHFFCVPRHRKGLTTFAFDVQVEPDYDLVHEWRDNSTPYLTGPRLRIKDGWISAGDKHLLPIAAGEWVHLEIEAKLGDQADNLWSVTVTLPGKPAQHFDHLPCLQPGWKALEWLGFSSPGTRAAKCWLDELDLRHR